MPNDTVQAAALATAMRDPGCKRVVAVHDGEVYGKGVGTLMRRDASPGSACRSPSHRRIAPRTRSFGAHQRRHCVAYTGITANGAVRMFRSRVGCAARSCSRPTASPSPASPAALRASVAGA